VSATPSGQRAAVVRRRVRVGRRMAFLHTRARGGYPRWVLSKGLHRLGMRGWYLHLTSLATVWLCITLWIRAKTVDQEERGNAERRALFVGLWPPMFWLIGDAVERHE
jgi:hypothetical protein